MSTRRCAAGSNRSLTNVAIAKPERLPRPASARDSASSTCDRARLSDSAEALVHKISGYRSMATATVCRHAMSAVTSPSRPTLPRSHLRPVSGDRFLRSLLATRTDFRRRAFSKRMLAQLAAAQRSANNSAWLACSVRPRNLTCVAWPIPTAR